MPYFLHIAVCGMGLLAILFRKGMGMGRKSILRKVRRKSADGTFRQEWNEPIANFLKAIKLGMNNIKACEFAGFGDKVLYEWINRGESDLEQGQDTVYSEFVETLKKTRAECQAFHLQNVIRAGQNGNWQASAWILERIFPTSFGQNRQESSDDDRIEVMNDVPRQ